MLANSNPVRWPDTFFGKDGMSVVAHTPRNILNGLSRVQQHGEYATRLHCLKLKFRFDEVIGTDHAPKVQFFIGRIPWEWRLRHEIPIR